ERVRIERRTEFAAVFVLFEIIPALDEVKPARGAAVMTGVEAALGIDFEAKRVAATFREYLVGVCFGMVPPDHAAFEVNSGRRHPACPRWLRIFVLSRARIDTWGRL